MRIAGGTARGATLKVPKISDIRPAQEMVRQAVFSILGDKIESAQVLDLYAGSGAYGLEALSRGAAFAVFVDSHPMAVQTIIDNATKAKFEDQIEAIRHDALRHLTDSHESYDIIFADPPYSYQELKPLLYHLAEHLKSDGLLIFEHDKKTTVESSSLELIDQRKYGASTISIFKAAKNIS